MSQGERRLAAIIFTDIEGYTVMAQTDESVALRLLEEHRQLIRPILARYGGREVKTMGDAFLVEFDSALDATNSALEMQKAIIAHNENAKENLLVRIGIHVGDVVHSGGDVYGDAVNIASRIEPLAKGGGICISDQVYAQVRNKLPLRFELLGPVSLKNVAFPVSVYRVGLPSESEQPTMNLVSDRKRIAILPFSNISPDPKDEYFADGLTEELIANLASITGLRVIARASVMKFKSTNKGIGEISRELNVGTVLEGSVRKSGSKLRVAVQLIDSATEEHLWVQNYDKEMEDVFAIQSDIAQRVAEALKVKLLSGDIKEIENRATANIEAYTYYLKGRHHWAKRSEAGLTSAISSFEKAIQSDPKYALAYVGLADCYSILGYYAYRAPKDVYPKAKGLATKALELDEGLAEAHASVGEVLMHYYHDWEGAEDSLKRSMALNPNYAIAHLWYSTLLQATGKVVDSIAEEMRGLELDPLSMIINTDLGRAYYFSRRLAEAEEQYRKAIELDPTFAIAHKGLAEVHALAGRYEEAVAGIERAMEISGGSLFIKDDLGYVYALSGKTDKAREVVGELKALASQRYVPPYGIAVIYFALGENDLGFEWLERAYRDRCFMTFIKIDPVFDKVRDDSRFKAILDRMGLGDSAAPSA